MLGDGIQRINPPVESLMFLNRLPYFLSFLLSLMVFQMVYAESNTLLNENGLSHLAQSTLLTEEVLIQRQRIVDEERTNLRIYKDKVNDEELALPDKLIRLQVEDVTDKVTNAVMLEQETLALNRDKVSLILKNQQDTIQNQQALLTDKQELLVSLAKNPSQTQLYKTQLADAREQVDLLTRVLGVEAEYATILQTRLNLTTTHHKLITEWYQALQNIRQHSAKQDLETAIQQEHQTYLSRAADFRQRLEKVTNDAQRYTLNLHIYATDEKAQQSLVNLRLTLLESRIKALQDNRKQLVVSKKLVNDMARLLEEIEEIKQGLESKLALLNQQQENLIKRGRIWSRQDHTKYYRQGVSALKELERLLSQQSKRLPPLLVSAEAVHTTLADTYAVKQEQQLLLRRHLPSTLIEWQSLTEELIALPALLLREVSDIYQSIAQAIKQASYQTWGIIAVATIIWLGLFVWLRLTLTQIYATLSSIAKRSFAINSLLISMRLLHLNQFSVIITGLVLIVLWFIQPSETSLLLVLFIAAFWLGVKVPINLTWLLLSSKKLRNIKRRSKLYKHISWLVVITGFFFFDTALAHLFPLSLNLRDVIDTAFMLFLSFTLLPVLRIRNLVISVLHTELPQLQGYWFLVIRVISLLVPMSIFVVAVCGLMGYINLGWNVAKHLSLFLLVLTGWLIVRGIMRDIINVLKNLALKHSNYGLLWTQDLIPLLHKLLNIALFIAALSVLFRVNGWHNDVAIQEKISEFLSYGLFTLGKSTVTVTNVLIGVVTLWMVFWLGGWFRQITYRWIYSGISDLGIRHSLSVFTQYSVVLIGLLVTLRIVGIDLTTLTIFAGALGVGIGFGLQNIANNFISGILLLLERPLRTGDIVNIAGQHEGTVTQIGIRSLTIRAWNHQEIIVPNSEIISNSFTNWTHSDKVMRTTLMIGISYDDDLHIADTILRKIITGHSAILTDPDHSITLWDFANSSINFRVDYFINLNTHSIFKTRHEVLLTIWDSFKKAGITIPYPQQDVHVKHMTQIPTFEDMQGMPNHV